MRVACAHPASVTHPAQQHLQPYSTAATLSNTRTNTASGWGSVTVTGGAGRNWDGDGVGDAGGKARCRGGGGQVADGRGRPAVRLHCRHARRSRHPQARPGSHGEVRGSGGAGVVAAGAVRGGGRGSRRARARGGGSVGEAPLHRVRRSRGAHPPRAHRDVPVRAGRPADGETAADLRGPQWCRLVTEADRERAVAALGADPLRAGDGTAPQRLRERLARTRRSVASVLMDQSFYAGVGNIYRAEVLFRQGIDPATPASALTPGQVDAIWEDLVELMGYGVEAGRIDTVRPEHTPEAMGRPPRRDDHGGEVYVYRREGLPCLVCGTPVRARDLEGRTLFWCPTCQPPL
nr:zinc finger domain-containing protein [Corynebacterium bovis]